MSDLAEPQLPPFVPQRRPIGVGMELGVREGRSYAHLLNLLAGELGFEHQRTALRWLLDQLETCGDLRSMVLLLLDQSEDD